MKWVRDAWQQIVEIWNYDLVTVGEAPLSIGRLVLATFFIVGGLFLSRRISRFVAQRILSRIHMSVGALATLETVLFYTLLIFFTLLALRLANIPLTVFAVLGGALAIGIGFGSQAVVNNFISGMILLVEQPVKAGDIIEMENAFGIVERIGARSTLVRTPDNSHVIMPNSAFLEKAVVNWTLEDHTVRTIVRVGVAYGSNTALVAELLREVAQDHPRVLGEPVPLVLFSDFGDSALAFDLVFWLELHSVIEQRKVASEVRFMIDTQFRAHNVVIAFPQQDIHFDATQPIPVRILSEKPPESGAD